VASRLETTIREIHAELVFPVPVGLSIGRLRANHHKSPPHVSWVPVGGPHDPPAQRGGREVTDQGPIQPPNGNLAQTGVDTRQESCATRVVSVVAIIWGKDLGPCPADVDPGLEGTEELLHQVMAAAQRVIDADLRFDREVWLTQEEDAAYWGVKGQAVQLFLNWRVPVIHRVDPLVTIIGHTHGCQLNSTLEDDTPAPP
jgi:hypothetical protein